MIYQVGESGYSHKYIPVVPFWQIQVVGIQMIVQLLHMSLPTPLNTDTTGSDSHLLSPLQFAEVQSHSVCDSLAEHQNGESN